MIGDSGKHPKDAPSRAKAVARGDMGTASRQTGMYGHKHRLRQ